MCEVHGQRRFTGTCVANKDDVGVIQVIGATPIVMLDKILHSLDAFEILLIRTMDGPCNATRRDSRALTHCLDRRTEHVDTVDAHCPKPLTDLGAQGTVGDGVQDAERPPFTQELPDSLLDHVRVVDLRQALDGDLDSVELAACSTSDLITRRTQRIAHPRAAGQPPRPCPRR